MITDRLNIVIVSDSEAFAQAMNLRREIFVGECKLDEHVEFDGNDYCSTHILALDGNKPIGTMRIRYFSDFVKMERMCVLKDYRKTDVAEQIMQKGMLFVAQKGYDKVYGICKKELLSRWKKDGFEVIPDAPCIEQKDYSLIPVWCKLQKPSSFITMQTSAEILNAKEGEWFNDKSSSAVDRIKALTDKVKFMKSDSAKSEQKWFAPLIYPLSNKTDDKSY